MNSRAAAPTPWQSVAVYSKKKGFFCLQPQLVGLQLILILCIFSGPTAADDKVSEEVSQQYYFALMKKARTYRIEPDAAGKYLRGVWRLDRRAHIGGGHYTRADKGDDVSLICNNERLIQVDFNQHQGEFIERTQQLAKLTVNADGSLSFGKLRRYTPLDDNHMAVSDYDYIVVLQRVSGMTEKKEQMAYPVDSKE